MQCVDPLCHSRIETFQILPQTLLVSDGELPALDSYYARKVRLTPQPLPSFLLDHILVVLTHPVHWICQGLQCIFTVVVFIATRFHLLVRCLKVSVCKCSSSYSSSLLMLNQWTCCPRHQQRKQFILATSLEFLHDHSTWIQVNRSTDVFNYSALKFIYVKYNFKICIYR